MAQAFHKFSILCAAHARKKNKTKKKGEAQQSKKKAAGVRELFCFQDGRKKTEEASRESRKSGDDSRAAEMIKIWNIKP